MSSYLPQEMFFLAREEMSFSHRIILRFDKIASSARPTVFRQMSQISWDPSIFRASGKGRELHKPRTPRFAKRKKKKKDEVEFEI